MSSFTGNAPFIKMKIFGQTEREVDALLDTGAYRTVLPLKICEELGLQVSGIQNVKGICCSLDLPIFECDVEISGLRLNKTTILGSEYQMPLLGRDIIQNFKLSLDWKKKMICIKDPLTQTLI